MILFRIDRRRYKIGQIIEPNSTYFDCLKEESLEVEKMLDETRNYSIPLRRQCLFLFLDLSCSMRFWEKYGGHIYIVTLDSNPYHRADMNILDSLLNVFKITKDKTIRKKIAEKYWEAGTHTFNPCYELLVKCAKVEDVLVSDDNSWVDFRKELSSNGNIIERSRLYKNLYNNITSFY